VGLGPRPNRTKQPSKGSLSTVSACRANASVDAVRAFETAGHPPDTRRWCEALEDEAETPCVVDAVR
jgi:hypothetical protein